MRNNFDVDFSIARERGWDEEVSGRKMARLPGEDNQVFPTIPNRGDRRVAARLFWFDDDP
jgi:hypothetical protein